MQAIKDITLQLSAETERQLTDRIAWFYLRHLNDADAKPAAALNQLLTRGERAELPQAQGAKEKEARSGPCTRKALLEAQLYDTISSYTKQFEMTDDGIPKSLRQQMNGRLASFNEQAARKLAENAVNCIRQGGSAAQTVQEMLTVFDKAVKRFAGDVDTAYTQASWYCLIKEYENEGHHRFRYVVEDKDELCNACLLQSEQTYTLSELLKQNLLPPLHPDCRCALVPDDELPAADDRDSGGFASRGKRAEGNWYDALLRIPADAKKLVSGVMTAQQERLRRGTLAGFADWFTLGIVSSAWNSMSERFAALTDDPSLYTALDWATMGSAGMVKGAVAPEEPLSLEHWLNALGTASLALGAYQMARNYARVSVDDVAAFERAVKTRSVSSPAARSAADYSLKREQQLIQQLELRHEKFTRENIMRIEQLPSGKIVWLETGNNRAGFQHILAHVKQFQTQGITQDELADYIMDALTNGEIVGMQGTREIYESTYKGVTRRIAVTIGNNGFIVGANPQSMPK